MLLVINIVDLLVSEIYCGYNLLCFDKQGGADIVGVKDEHPPIFVPLLNYLAFFLDEAPEVRKPHLHPLVDDLSDRHKLSQIGVNPTMVRTKADFWGRCPNQPRRASNRVTTSYTGLPA